MTTPIELTDVCSWDADRQCLSFEVLVEGSRARCLLSWEILSARFDAPSPELAPEIFVRNRGTIKTLAEFVLAEQGLDENGELYIRAEDVE